MDNIVAMNSYFTGLAGESDVQSVLATWRIASTKLKESDFGEDLLCDVFLSSDNGRAIRTNLTFRVQVKTTQNFSKTYIRKTRNGFSFPVETSLLKSWLEAYYPVVLVIWNQEQKTGYWCIPSNEVVLTEICNQKTKVIHFYNDFLSSEMIIKDHVQHYYNGLYKANEAVYRCKVYPIWMPKYRLFTPIETQSIFMKLLAQDAFDFGYDLPDLLPSYLTSYNNVDLTGGLSCLTYTLGKISINDYLNGLLNLLSDIKENGCEEWISYIISPIELICEESRPINQLTGWQSFSLLNGVVVSDYQFTYEIENDFYPTQPVRATSDNQSLSIHTSGDFAVLVLSAGFAVPSRISYENRLSDILDRSYCVWDISECTAKEIDELKGWCINNFYQISDTDIGKNIVIISHPSLSWGSYGTLLPGVLTWRELDKLDFISQDFISKIPFGKQPKKSLILLVKEKLGGHKYDTEVLLQNFNYINGEVLNHADRLIHFVTYIHPLDKKIIMDKIKNFSSLLKQELSDFCSEIKLFIEDDYTDNMADLILNIKPNYNISTAYIIKIAASHYKQICATIFELCNNQANMAYYIKYQLDRYLPEELVRQSSTLP